MSPRPATPSAPLGALLAVAAVALAACAPPPVRAPLSGIELTLSSQEQPPPPAPPPPPEPASEPPSAPAPAMVAVAPPGRGCTLTGHRVFTPSRPGLTLAMPDGTGFALTAPSPASVKITATFPEGDVIGPGVGVELDDGHVVVRGVTPTVSLLVAPRSLFTMGDANASSDFLAPVGDVLVVENVASGTATVAVWIGTDISASGGLRAQRRCNELQLDEQRADAGTVARFVTGKPPAAPRGRAAASVDKETPLSSARGEAPSVLLGTADAPAPEVEVIERRGREARVFWYHDGYALFGWVPAAALHRQAPSVVAAPAGKVAASPPPAPTGKVATSPPPAPGDRPLVCSDDVPLFVEAGGKAAEVGRVRKGTPIVVSEHRGSRISVAFRDVAVSLEHGAAWILREADTAKVCQVR